MMTDERLKQLDSVMITNDRTAEIAIDECVLEIHRLRAELAAFQQIEYCKDCGCPMSQCGDAGPDGEPSMDCEVCRLRSELARYKTPCVDNVTIRRWTT